MAAIGEEKGTRSKRKEKEDEEFVPAAIGDWTAAPVSSTAASRARPWQRQVKPCELVRLPAAAAAAGCRGFGYRGRTGKYKNTLAIPTSQLDIPIPVYPYPTHLLRVWIWVTGMDTQWQHVNQRFITFLKKSMGC